MTRRIKFFLSAESLSNTTFVLGLLGLVLIGSYGYRSATRLVLLSQSLTKTHRILDETKLLSNLLASAEAGYRGYLISRKTEYLTRYLQTQKDVPTQLQTLDRLLISSPNNTKINHLKILFSQRFSLMDRGIKTTKKGSFAQAFELTKEGEGERVSEQIREEVNSLGSDERRELNSINQDAQYMGHLATWLDVLGISLAVCLLLAASIFTRRLMKAQRRSETLVRELNTGLEKKIEERTKELQNTVKELDAFTSSVSHDLRAPLRTVNGFATLLLEKKHSQLDEESQTFLHQVINGVQKMGDLVDDLLEFSKLGRLNTNLKEINMTELARSVFEESKEEDILTHGNYRAVELKLAPLPSCVGDYALVRQVLVNLFSNAIKYTRGKDLALISVDAIADPLEQKITYSVQDNGAGFNMKYADRLFRVFQRLHSENEFEGTGVGLAIVQRIIEKHGGRVWAEGAVGKGSTFSFQLPYRENAPNA